MEGSILADVRSACNLESTDTTFDKQLIPLVNGQIMMAHQFGVGTSGFLVHDTSETWADWLGDEGDELAAVKVWLGYNVLLMFDPPDNSSVIRAYQDQITKMEWMLREKSEEKGFVKKYVPEKADFYGKEEESAPDNTDTEPDEQEEYYYPDEPDEEEDEDN